MPPPAPRDKVQVIAALRSSLAGAVALALPPRCPGCGLVVAADHRFCTDCWSGLRFLGPPWCAACHAPLACDLGDEARCGDCLAAPPRHGGIDAAVAYGPVARALALGLKYRGRAAFAETMARAMARHVPGDAELFVPVPLHRWRLWSRGYNQSALIAAALSRRTGVSWSPDALRRTRATPVLRGLGARARRKAVAGVFAVDRKDEVAGRRIVLIDDVYTSGATADACVAALLRAKAARVSILCWARVLGDALAD